MDVLLSILSGTAFSSNVSGIVVVSNHIPNILVHKLQETRVQRSRKIKHRTSLQENEISGVCLVDSVPARVQI